MGTEDRFICDTGLSIAVNQSKTGPLSTRFGFLCMHRVPGGIITLSASARMITRMVEHSVVTPCSTHGQPWQGMVDRKRV